jgi:hypothetical protein
MQGFIQSVLSDPGQELGAHRLTIQGFWDSLASPQWPG